MASSAMLLRLALVGTDVSEEFIPSIIRVTRNGELAILVVTSNSRALRRNKANVEERCLLGCYAVWLL
jgi:hypothetical protein